MAKRASAERMTEIFAQVKSWGRWGSEDEAGALNLITADKRAAAARLVVTGETVSCAREFPVTPSPENPTPALHFMTRAGDVCAIEGTGGLDHQQRQCAAAFEARCDARQIFVRSRREHPASLPPARSRIERLPR